ncbi:MAG: hypothetical protein HYY79_12290 [Betaproteobacteria bacterium]|nr:hypothetical protein [Betaproteobacteria bacterium]
MKLKNQHRGFHDLKIAHERGTPRCLETRERALAGVQAKRVPEQSFIHHDRTSESDTC